MKLQLFGVLLCAVGTFSQVIPLPEPTVPHIDEIFVGRCIEYRELSSLCKVVPDECQKIDCKSAWEKFSGAFAHKGPCEDTQADYEGFAKYVSLPTPVNSTLFWSRTFGIVHELSNQGKRFYTLEDTLMGHVMNGLNWCGTNDTKSEDGIDYKNNCTMFTDCNHEAKGMKGFWAAASEAYSVVARGDVHVMLNGTQHKKTSTAFDKYSMFAVYELPKLNTEHVRRVRVMLAGDIGEPLKETCHTGSLVTMRQRVENRTLAWQCTSNPRDLKHLLCTDSPTTQECLFASKLNCKELYGSAVRSHVSYVSVLIVTAISMAIASQ